MRVERIGEATAGPSKSQCKAMASKWWSNRPSYVLGVPAGLSVYPRLVGRNSGSFRVAYGFTTKTDGFWVLAKVRFANDGQPLNVKLRDAPDWQRLDLSGDRERCVAP